MDQTPIIYYPLDAVEKKYNEGKLAQIEIHLLQYITKHYKEVLDESQSIGSSLDADGFYSGVESLIRKRGSVHLPSEMAEQIKEINKEIWYRAEEFEGDINQQTVSEDWTLRYSYMWREARKIELNFLVEKNQAKIKDLYQA